MSRPAEAAGGEEHANRLNPDEWAFLRATPDFDAEEMSSVVQPGGAFTALAGWDTPPPAVPPPAEPFAAPGEFPEVGSLVGLLDDLLERPRGGSAPSGAADATWAEVPAAEEWAALMEPRGARAAATPTPAPPPAARDVLLDALEAGERIGLLPGSEGR